LLRDVARSEHGELTGTYTELQGCDFQSTQQEKCVTHTSSFSSATIMEYIEQH